MAAARLLDQCGSEYVLFSRFAASRSTQRGSMLATSRAHSLEVSTNSAAITYCGLVFASAEPGKIMNLVLRAPWYSRVSTFRIPICDSNPDNRDWWTASACSAPITSSASAWLVGDCTLPRCPWWLPRLPGWELCSCFASGTYRSRAASSVVQPSCPHTDFNCRTKSNHSRMRR